MDSNSCPVPVQKLSTGVFMFGTKKITLKLLNGKLLIRVGGGYMSAEEFIERHGASEFEKIKGNRLQSVAENINN